jgi:hypothetical protein
MTDNHINDFTEHFTDNLTETDAFDEKKLLEDIKLKIDQYLKESYQSVLHDLNNGNLKMINHSINHSTPNEDLISQQLGRVSVKTKSVKTKSIKKRSGKKISSKRSIKRFKTNTSNNILPPILKSEEDSLTKYGYRLSKSPLARRRALKKAARSRGTLTVLKRVNLIGNYSKSVPTNYDKLRSDVEYLKDVYAKEKLEKIKAIYAPRLKSKSAKSKSAKSKSAKLAKLADFVF